MQNTPSKKNPFVDLARQNVCNIEDFISLLKHIANRNKLVFFSDFADLLTECSTLGAVLRVQDPRPIILSFISQYQMFNKTESAFYYQIFEPALDIMISPGSNFIHRISSTNLFKRIVIKTITSRFNLETPFVRFIEDMQAEIKMRAQA